MKFIIFSKIHFTADLSTKLVQNFHHGRTEDFINTISVKFVPHKNLNFPFHKVNFFLPQGQSRVLLKPLDQQPLLQGDFTNKKLLIKLSFQKYPKSSPGHRWRDICLLQGCYAVNLSKTHQMNSKNMMFV